MSQALTVPEPEHDARILPLVDAIYDAVADPAECQRFAGLFSAALGDAAVAVSLDLTPGNEEPRSESVHRVHLDPRHWRVAWRYAEGDDLPWGRAFLRTDRFHLGREMLPDERVAETAFYREWMKPQGLAAEGPLGFAIGPRGALPTTLVMAWRRVGGRSLTEADRALADALVPHLRRADHLVRRLEESRRRQDALSQVVDRLPTGVVLLDASGRVVGWNRSAERFVALEDGIALEPDGPRAALRHENEALCALCRRAAAAAARGRLSESGAMAISRPSGRRSFSAVVIPLLGPPTGGTRDVPVAVLFLTDPEAGQPSQGDVLRTLYSLTPAEAELARLLASDHTLSEVAAIRGVKLNTARTQLKQVFAKTGARRQSELVRLVLSSVGSIDVTPGGPDRHEREGEERGRDDAVAGRGPGG